MTKREKELRTQVNTLLEEVRDLNNEIECLKEENRILTAVVKTATKPKEPAVPPSDFWPAS